MTNIEIARKIVLGYINFSRLELDEKLVEIASVNEDDTYLLKHINIMLEILGKAKEEIERL